LQQYFSELPPDASWISYQNARRSVLQMFQLLDRAGEAEILYPLPEEGDSLFVSIPDTVSEEARVAILGALGTVIAHGSMTGHGLFGTALLLHDVR